jgi:hypothetical protein
MEDRMRQTLAELRGGAAPLKPRVASSENEATSSTDRVLGTAEGVEEAEGVEADEGADAELGSDDAERVG